MARTATLIPPARKLRRAQARMWVDQQPRGRFARIGGDVVAMAPTRVAHARVKAHVWRARRNAIRHAGAPCDGVMDGVTVVAVASPSTAVTDGATKRSGDFTVPSGTIARDPPGISVDVAAFSAASVTW